MTSKKQQRWLWYAWEPRLKRIIAHTFSRRNKRTLCQLPALLSRFNVTFDAQISSVLMRYCLSRNMCQISFIRNE
ncbi:IS1 family transposase [Providencia rettgeri]|nr:IS1 family transposase [Providencia rettgeri]